MLAPLLGVVAAGLGVSIVAAGALVALLELVGFAAPAAGWFVGRLGPSRVVPLALVSFAAFCLVCAAAPNEWWFAAGLVGTGLSALTYEAGAAAWVALSSPYRDRGRWLARLDLAWAGGLLVGLPVAALLSTWSWRLAFVAASLLALVPVIPLRSRLGPPIATQSQRQRGGTGRWRMPPGGGVFAAFALLALASQQLAVTYGFWLRDQFGFTTAIVGAVGFCLGAGDLTATLASIRWTDRLGKVRSAIIGCCGLMVAASTLALAAGNAAVGIVALVAMLIGHEFALLATKSILTELVPTNPALGLGLGFGATAAARALGAILGAFIYAYYGFAPTAMCSAITAALAALAYTHLVNEPTTTAVASQVA